MKLSILHFKHRMLCLSFFIAMIHPATAQIHTIAIKGYVTFVDDGNNFLNGSIVAGDSLSGIIKYDVNVTDNNPLTEVGDYWCYSSPSGIQVYVGNVAFITDNANVSFLVEAVNNYLGEDNIVFRSYNNVYASIPYDFLSKEISWQLDDFNETALSSTVLPLFINLGEWQQPVGLNIKGETDFDYPLQIQGIITSIDTGSIAVSAQSQAVGKNNTVNISPNPSPGIFNIDMNEAMNEHALVQIFNSYGKEVFVEKNGNHSIRIDLSSEPPGVYFLELKGHSGITRSKLIKQ